MGVGGLGLSRDGTLENERVVRPEAKVARTLSSSSWRKR